MQTDFKMTVRKGLKSLVESTPNFSNQALENAINELKIGWASDSIQLDTDIANNQVLTDTQKNDLKDTINNISYLNVGRYLGDIVRHTNTILDGSIIPGNPDVVTGEDGQGTFSEILQLIQGLQQTIPSQYGLTAAEKNRDVNDHLGILGNMFTATEDSSKPVFTSMKDSITFINNASLATETALVTAITNLRNFINSVVADSTDFQQTLDTFATAVATANTNFHNALGNEPYLTKRTQLIADRDSIETQRTLENSNITTLRSYTETLTENSAYIGLADDPKLRTIMANVAQDPNWQSYFNEYEQNQSYSNPLYDIDQDSDKASVIDQVMKMKGLPDVQDPLDLDAVVEKAKKDSRIDTKNFDNLTIEQIITDCCRQLDLSVKGTEYNQSERLLSNLNERDRDIIAQSLDLNESSNTIS